MSFLRNKLNFPSFAVALSFFRLCNPRLRAVSLFSVVRRAKRETRKWPLPRACIALTKSEEKERLLAV